MKGSIIMIDPYYFYMAEQEGLIKTREGRLNRALIQTKDLFNRYCRELTMYEFVTILHDNEIISIESKELVPFLQYVEWL